GCGSGNHGNLSAFTHYLQRTFRLDTPGHILVLGSAHYCADQSAFTDVEFSRICTHADGDLRQIRILSVARLLAFSGLFTRVPSIPRLLTLSGLFTRVLVPTRLLVLAGFVVVPWFVVPAGLLVLARLLTGVICLSHGDFGRSFFA